MKSSRALFSICFLVRPSAPGPLPLPVRPLPAQHHLPLVGIRRHPPIIAPASALMRVFGKASPLLTIPPPFLLKIAFGSGRPACSARVRPTRRGPAGARRLAKARPREADSALYQTSRAFFPPKLLFPTLLRIKELYQPPPPETHAKYPRFSAPVWML